MFSTNDRAFLNENPFLLINGDICKFKEIVCVEGGEQVILYRSLKTGTIHKCTAFQFGVNAEREPITAAGLCYELMLELKSIIEINQLKG